MDLKTAESTDQSNQQTVNDSNTSASTADIWSRQAQDYLSGGDYKSTVNPPQDTSDLKTRVEAFGLANFDTFDNDNDGLIESKDVKFAYKRIDNVAEQLLVANFKQIDTNGDDKVSRDELVAISQDRFKLGILPDTRILDKSPPDLAAQKKVLDLVDQRIKQHPHDSTSDYFDKSVEAMAKAVVTGDSKAFDAMVKNFSKTENLYAISKSVNKLLQGSAIHVRNEDSKHVEVGEEFGNRVYFSPDDQPRTNHLNLSAEDAMKSLGKSVVTRADSIQSQFSYEDRQEQRHKQAEQLTKGLSTKLTDKDGLVLLGLIESAQDGKISTFRNSMNATILKDPQSAYRVSKALNEITAGKDVDFNAVSVGRTTIVQARNFSGSKAITFDGRNDRALFDRTFQTPSSSDWMLKPIKDATESK